MPLPRMHEHHTAFRAFLATIRAPDVNLPKNADAMKLRFFTDGGAKYPRCAAGRIATWSVIQDLSLNLDQIKCAADYIFLEPPQFPLFHTSAVGIVKGDQTVARAELFAILVAAKMVNLLHPIPEVEFVTDASYVCSVIRLIQSGFFTNVLHRFSNGDLIQELAQVWNHDRFCITKVKSHRNPDSAKDLMDLWYIAGNMCADTAATLAYSSIPSAVRELSEQIVRHVEVEAKMLQDHFHFLADFNRKRCQLLEIQKRDVSKPSLIRPRQVQHRVDGLFPSNLMGAEACDAMANFMNEAYCVRGPFDVDDAVYQSCLQGTNISKALVKWYELLKWPENIQPDYDLHAAGDWGISWFELLVSFYITTGWRCPIRIEGAGAQSKYLDYGADQAALLPDNKRSVSLQILCFRNLWQNVSTMVGKDILPRFDNYKCFSVSRLGFKSPVAGLPCRPIIPNQDQTVRYVWNYIVQLNGSVALHKPLYIKHLNILCHFDQLLELAPRERWSKNQALMKRLRNLGRGGG